jgi:hypothetical protein
VNDIISYFLEEAHIEKYIGFVAVVGMDAGMDLVVENKLEE